MSSHLGLEPQDPRPDDVSHFDVLANDQADMAAKMAAKRAAKEFRGRLPSGLTEWPE